MKPYRLKHKPSGLYYQPVTKGGNNLGKNGKVYLTEHHNGLTGERDPMLVKVKGNSIAYKLTKDVLAWEDCKWERNSKVCYIPHSDFERENISDLE